VRGNESQPINQRINHPVVLRQAGNASDNGDYVVRVFSVIALLIGAWATQDTKYGGIHAAQQELGNVEDIQSLFVDFQQHLYSVKVA
jgi:hypothetical protein